MLQSSNTRLAALFTAAFALSVVLLGVVTLLSTDATLRRQFDSRVRAESTALVRELNTEGLEGVVRAVQERDRMPGGLDYGLFSPMGKPVAGRLATRLAVQGPQPGWSSLKIVDWRGTPETIRVLTTPLPGGYRLLVGDDDEFSKALQGTLLRSFTWALAGVVVLGILGGWGFSVGMRRRLANMTGAAEAIIQGDLDRRMPVRGSADELDRLGVAFNRTLDRISALMDSLRQVSNDIAHDLRTPLTRLRHKLEATRTFADPAERAEAVESALRDVDAILETFSALLRIAQVEGGARRAGFRPVDLSTLGRTVVEAFAPSAEDAGQALTFEGEPELVVDGDRELLTQMLANLVENALRHAGADARIVVRVWRRGGGGGLSVTDNGPGVPEPERAWVFNRFYRLERSRSTPGNGLGLALVAAVARLHGAIVSLADAGPGLDASIAFPSTTLAFSNVADSAASHQEG